MPSPRTHRRRRLTSLAAGVAVTAAALGAGLPAHAADPTTSGTATAVAGKVDLDVQLLNGVLGALRLGGPDGLDIPLANLSLGEASAPNASGDSANFTNSVLRLRDNLIDELHLPGPEADLLKADAVSGTARVVNGPGGYSQAYATVANLRLFLPLLQLPGASADNGILKIDAVSAQATCQPGQKPSASAKLPTTIVLLGRQIPVPLSGDIPLDIGVAKLDVHLSPVSTTDTKGASAAVEARITVDAVGLAKVSGAIVLASAACTMPGAAAVGSGATTGATGSGTGPAAGTPTTTAVGGTSVTTGTANGSAGGATSPGNAAGNGDKALAATGASGSLLPIAGIAAVLVLGGAGLLVYLKRKSAGAPPED
ncbi:LPXTG cell wall anchor domain-containing protein [Catenulispora subtropica]|uniref:LPXTG-motif cell wall anchor domain protein n=1 Tax=Catenulispora subtropica TaxID=450798 RepID=A0ABN2RV96_9ACTN